MRPHLHHEISQLQRYACLCCGRGCRTFLVPVRPEERAAIEKLEDWRAKSGVRNLFIKTRFAGPSGYGLMKWHDGRCIFLDAENLCIIHKLHGFEAKPLACRLFPFILTPFGRELRVGLRFDCPGVCGNQGKELAAYLGELNQLARQLVPEGAASAPIPKVTPRFSLTAEQFEIINEALLAIVSSNAVPLRQRLHWLERFLDQVGRVKWPAVPTDEFQDFVNLIRGGTLAELQAHPGGGVITRGRDAAPDPRARKLLGQYFYILTQPTTFITNQKVPLVRRFRQRFESLRAMRQLARIAGPLPRIQPDWPELDLTELENFPGLWPAEVDELVGRWLACRFAGLNYCGPNFYGYSLLEGARALLLGTVTLGWAMRIYARAAGRVQLQFADAQQALLIIDGNLGTAQALAFGPARWRLEYVSDALASFIDQYCGQASALV